MDFFRSRFYCQYLSLFSTTFKTVFRNFTNSKFEPEVAVLDKLIEKGSVCIDIGGAYGRYALPLSRIVGKTGKVYSFEPGQYSYKVFICVKHIHRLRNVVLIKKALSSKEGEIKLLSPVKKSGKVGPSLAYINEHDHLDTVSEMVPMTTLDMFCLENNINNIHFIKCDTEGSELHIYRGAHRMIDRCLPTVLSEVDDNNLRRYGDSVKDMEDFFLNKGYKIIVFCKDVLRPIDHIKENGNYFFVHESKIKGL